MTNRFWSKIATGAPDECWLWIGSVDSRGYGSFNNTLSPFPGRRTRIAHRIAYTLSKGEIPQGEGFHGTVVMHRCDNKLCCNPAHLELGSHADNMADMKNKGRRKNIGTGSANGRAKLTIEQVLAIRSDCRPQRVIAAEYSVSVSQIQRLRAGKQWNF